VKYYCSAMPTFRLPSRKPKSCSLPSPPARTSPSARAGCAGICKPQRQPLYRQIFGRIFNLSLRIVLGMNFKDTQCGFKAFTRQAATTIFPLQKIERWGFDPELLYVARKFGFKIVEVPVAWAHREGTRIDPLRDGIKMFLELLKIRWNALAGEYAARKD
jgi:hypothetical protein